MSLFIAHQSIGPYIRVPIDSTLGIFENKQDAIDLIKEMAKGAINWTTFIVYEVPKNTALSSPRWKECYFERGWRRPSCD